MDIETLMRNILTKYLNVKKIIEIVDFKIYLEIFFLKLIKIRKDTNIYFLAKYFNKKYSYIERYNLDFEPFLIELNSKLFNEK